jgi:ABC-type enterochelin transport system substrate-binding protein
MSISKSTILLAAFALATGASAFAAQTSSQKSSAQNSNAAQVAVHEELGTVKSMTDSELVLTHDVNGIQEDTAFKLDPSTKKEGAIAEGVYVTLYYKTQNKERIATEVKADRRKS